MAVSLPGPGPRQVHLAHTVSFPLHAAARALGVRAVVLQAGLHRLRDARLLAFSGEHRTTGEPHVTVTLMPFVPGRHERP